MTLSRKDILFFLFIFPCFVYAQSTCDRSLQGRIIDADTQLPITGATVKLYEFDRSAKTDGHGFFNFKNVCAGTYMIQISALGFQEKSLSVEMLNKNQRLTIVLAHEGIVLHDVNVIGHTSGIKSTSTKNTLNKSDLAETTGLALADILQNIPGITVLQTGGTITKPVIHGMHSNRVLIVNNGIKQEGQQWGSEHAPEVDPFIASDITVIKGAESVRFGPEAIGGVILVEPAPLPIGTQTTGSVDLVGSSNGRTGIASVMLQGGVDAVKGLSWRAQGTLKQGGNIKSADYYLNNTGINEANYSAALSYRSSHSHFDAYYSHFKTDIGIFESAHIGSVTDLESLIENGRPFADGTFSYKIDVPRQAVTHDLLKLKLHRDLKNGGLLDIQYGFQQNAREEYDKRRGDRSAIPALDLVLDAHSIDVTYDRINANSLRTLLGVNSTAIINNSIPGTQATPIIPNYDSFGLGVFAVKRLVRQNYELEAGLRYDYKDLDAAGYRDGELYGGEHSFHNASGSVGAIWRPRQSVNLRSNLGLSWRPPTINELYSSGLHHGSASVESGDSNLKSEQGYKWISTLQFANEQLNVEVSGFAHYLKNYIYLNPTGAIYESLRGAFPVFEYQQTDAMFFGVDMDAEYVVSSGLIYSLKGSFLRVSDLNNESNIPMIPSNRLTNQIRYNFTSLPGKLSDLYAGAQYLTVFEQTRYNKETDFTEAPPTYSLLNLNVGTTMELNAKSVGINVSAHNLLNKSYKDYMNRFRYYAHDMGRNITLRLSFNF